MKQLRISFYCINISVEICMISATNKRLRNNDRVFWNEGSAFKTYFFDAFSIIIPPCEHFIIDAVESSVESNPLFSSDKKDTESFISDEERHSQVHKAYNKKLADSGYAIENIEKRISNGVDKLIALQPEEKLIIAAAIEYLTMIISFIVLKSDRWITSEKVYQANVWRWHCNEEIDHQGVTESLLKKSNVSYFRRVSIFVSVTIYLLSDLFINICALYHSDRKNQKISQYSFIRSFALFVIYNGLDLLRLTYNWAKYFRVSNSKDDKNNNLLVENMVL